MKFSLGQAKNFILKIHHGEGYPWTVLSALNLSPQPCSTYFPEQKMEKPPCPTPGQTLSSTPCRTPRKKTWSECPGNTSPIIIHVPMYLGNTRLGFATT